MPKKRSDQSLRVTKKKGIGAVGYRRKKIYELKQSFDSKY